MLFTHLTFYHFFFSLFLSVRVSSPNSTDLQTMKLFTFSSVLAGICAKSSSSKGCDNTVPGQGDATCDSIWYSTLNPAATCSGFSGGDCDGCECPLENFLENFPPSACSLPTFEETSLFLSGILAVETFAVASGTNLPELTCLPANCPICSALFSAFQECDYSGYQYEGDEDQLACFCEAAEPFLTSGGEFTTTGCEDVLGPFLSLGNDRRLQQQEGRRSLKSKGKAGKGKAKGSKGKPKGTKGNKSKEGRLNYGRFWSDAFKIVLDPELQEMWNVIYLGITQLEISYGVAILPSADE
ncbi:hypothetical protein ScalyP_jg11431 [Parmales sp. scaly parma]|nr:hypothetical protein ScalyP_jg11431 [Parmales sp. scaly parma]